MIDQLWEELEQLVLSSDPDYGSFQYELRRRQKQLRGVDLARSDVLLRLAIALQGFEDDTASTLDIAALLRQAIRAFRRRLVIPTDAWRSLDMENIDNGLRATEITDATVELTADPWRPRWLSDTEHIDELALRRSDEPGLGDGMLFQMSEGWTAYQSAAQQEAVHASLFAAPGTTTLVTLPTGAGKSMCVTLPAWVESDGGSAHGGTTLVIVPTVSLAIDQYRQVKGYFAQAVTEEFAPHCWIGSTPPSERAVIRRGLERGTLPLLFLSPEALLGSELSSICLEAAQAGTIRRLVIDEAHIVGTWGAGFRTEFQFLAAYRRQLLSASKGQLRTLLLSATLSQRTEDLLIHLFGGDDQPNVVRASRLRPEPSYWFSTADAHWIRSKRVLEALRYLPRPAILYVMSPDHASDWLASLRQQGYMRIAAYTGLTGQEDRLFLQQRWSDGEIDIMVATSAFGLGVDKRDVRTVIHACLPENVDRFYQEVGRGGRDGNSAISLTIATPADEDAAFKMTSSARITAQRAVERWEGMLDGARVPEGLGDVLLVNLDTVPLREPEMRRNERNHEWNEHVLLLLQRARLLDVISARREPHQGDEQPVHGPLLVVQVREPAILNDQDALLAAVDVVREREVADVQADVRQMARMVQRYAGGSEERCIALELCALYPDTARACGGCPACRREGRQPYAMPLPLSVDVQLAEQSEQNVADDLQRLAGHYRALHLQWEGLLDPAVIQDVAVMLVERGIQQIVLPAELAVDREWTAELIRRLGKRARIPHRLIQIDATGDLGERVVYRIPTAVVYPSEVEAADRLHRSLHPKMERGVLRVNVVASPLPLPSEHGRFVDRVNGMAVDLRRFVEGVAAAEPDLF